ncbi:MAG: NAD-dependent epimerase/dehydratase family protein [Alphaproteobacteria bacterium]
MNVLIFGATGMVGQGVLRECLLSTEVTLVQTVGRTPVEQLHSKLRNVVHKDMWNYKALEDKLTGFDACFFCLGVSSAGMSEDDYRHMTYDLTLSAAETLARLNPQMVFVYVSGAGTDSSEHGRSMWARIKGKTENALLHLPFKAAYMFRPAAIQPLHGIKSKTKAYYILYALTAPLWPLLQAIFPSYVLTTEQIGRAMIAAAKNGYSRQVLETTDIYNLSQRRT